MNYLPSNGQYFFIRDRKRRFFINYLSEKTFYSQVKCKEIRSVFEVSEMDGGFVCFSEDIPGQYVFFWCSVSLNR